MSFDELGLSRSLLRAVHAEGYREATPIQSQAIPTVLEGRDLMGCAQTGTGKTAAFALPTLDRLCGGSSQPPEASRGRRSARRRPIRSLALAPTRELAAQIEKSFCVYGKFTGLRSTVVYGGVSQRPQVRSLQAGVDILVATPGRLLDLMNQGYIDLANVEVLILDEADQMLDMGFLPDLRRIVAAVPRRDQTLMFSATMPDQIRQLAARWLRDPKYIQVGPAATPIEQVEQSVYFVETRYKPQLLVHFLRNTPFTRTLVFARTKHGADKIVKQLVRSGIRAAAIHGNKSQNVRTRTLEQFKSPRPPVLVATDIAARGLDVEGISHVVNYELPEVPEIYVHRIGRTARAGATGIATSFCGCDERSRLKRIERLTRRTIPVEHSQPEYSQQLQQSPTASRPTPSRPQQVRRRPRPDKKGRRTRWTRPA
ncbi:MAG: DEAD/DEAH box helicase [Pirellulaceae bacterium]|nr:DEAD/DEAH box helicase [Pirellulaceae bacterium]